MTRVHADAAKRRPQGVKAGLSLSDILSAASSIAPEDLTMQAVANRLGVDRKAVNHHVSDRETLLRLVASEAFARSFATVTIPAESDWREASRIYGYGIAAAVAALGSLAGHVRVSRSTDALLLAATEAVLAKLVEAGFDLETGMRAVAMLSDICDTYGQGVALTTTGGAGMRDQWLHEVLRELPEENPRYLSEAARSWTNTYDARQLDVSIEIFVRGLEGLAPA
ncbi:hypothetical protein [Promicromonospora sp. NPDC023987]|uniref:hypothetical protein n=1 Tax=Promicromonospora sp. NPDC023987 TaxID=3155360 RepID=UPI0033E6D499